MDTSGHPWIPRTCCSRQPTWDAGQATDGVMLAIQELRKQIGRPFGWYGVTPLMIYRDIPPYSAQDSLDLKPVAPNT